MTITIDLSPNLSGPLEQLAKQMGCPVEQAARTALAAFLRVPSEAGLDPELARAMEDSFRENDELYRRLAR